MTAPVEPGCDREMVLNLYRAWLAGERGLGRRHHRELPALRRGVPGRSRREHARRGAAGDLTAGRVLAFFQRLQAGNGPSPKSMAGPLRSLLRYLFAHGYLSGSLAGAVPPVARWRLASLPVRMDAAAVSAALLGVFDRSTELGSRNHAIVLLLARLGLRAGECAGLALEDVNWRAGTITIGGKGGRRDELPLVWDAGEAMAAYLRARPPGDSCRALFATAVSPRHDGLTRQAIGDVVRRGCVSAGLPEAGPHRLRHALAA